MLTLHAYFGMRALFLDGYNSIFGRLQHQVSFLACYPDSILSMSLVGCLAAIVNGGVACIFWHARAPAVGTTLILNFQARTKAGLPMNAKYRVLDAPKEEVESLVQSADKCKNIVDQQVRTPDEQVFIDKMLDILSEDFAKKTRIQEPVKTIEQFKVAKDTRLEPGEHVKVAGSGGASHTVTMSAKGNLYCSCPAWKFQKVASELRTCKHCDAVAGN